MKRSLGSVTIFGALILLLVILGALQYRWQTQISESERDKMRKAVSEEAARFAEDFNREIQGSYFNFQVGAEDWRVANYHPFVERYEFWRGKTKYPDLIDDFYFIDASGDGAPLKFDKEARTFTPVEWTSELRDLQKSSANRDTFQPIVEKRYTLVVPQHDEPERDVHVRMRHLAPLEIGSGVPESMLMPETYGFLVVKLDQNVIRDSVLPDLSAKHFNDQEFVLNIVDKDNASVFSTGDVKNADAQAPIFDLSPGDIIFFANKDLADKVGERRESMVLNSRVESRTSRSEINGEGVGTVQVEIKRDARPKTQIFATKLDSPEHDWTLSVQHRAGSIDAFVANTKYRNLAIGWGILGLLGISAAAIVFSTQRVRAFAQRQVDFVSSVSHEFRTPLAVIYSAGENLADGVANDPAHTSKYGELIKGEGRKLSGMVEQILEFAGANSGRRKFNFRPVAANEIVENAMDACRTLISGQHITLETDIDKNLPQLHADPDALSRAIQNLIANAVKYQSGTRWIRITAMNGDENVKISVEDHGIGISKTDLRQVFEPFFRAKGVVDAQIHGNGLGLALVKQTAEAHGGRVYAESELGKGSKFTIVLPVE